jgi:hypothetical protein
LNLSISFGGLPPREAGEIETYERLFTPIRFALFKEGYDGKTGRDFGYVSVRSAIGKAPDMRDDVRRAQLRYVAIPFSLVPDNQSVPYVVGDYTGGDPVPESLEGFVKLYQGDGLVLYKRVAP